MPIASILIPVYNRETLVARSINAALSQTITDIEIVIVDNQSTDGTFAVCSEFALRDNRIRLFQNTENIGPVRNWMKCAEHASAPYSKILFSDDLIAANFLERTIPYILSPECSLVYTPAIVGTEDWKGGVVYGAFINDCKLTREAFVRVATRVEHFTPVSPGAALFRTSDLRRFILTDLPGVEGYDFAGNGAGVDWLIYALTALNYKHVAYVSDPLTYFHAHANSISCRNEDNLVQVGYDLAKKWLLATVKGI